MRIAYLIAIIGTAVLGIGHTLLTWKIYKPLNKEAFWFMSAGLALIFVAIANYMNLGINSSFTFQCVLIVNGILTVFMLFLVRKAFQPTIIAVTIFSIFLLIGSIVYRIYSKWVRKHYTLMKGNCIKKTTANERFHASGGADSYDTERVTSFVALVRTLPMPPPAWSRRHVSCKACAKFSGDFDSA